VAIAPQTPQVDVAEYGRVLATLDDWRAIAFVLVIIIFFSFVERLWASYRFSREREKMWDIAQTMGTNAEKITDALSKLVIEIQVLRGVSSRIESNSSGT
jgi:hypothetical protein